MKASFLVVANWKMNGCREKVSALSRELVTRNGTLKHVEVVVCPPYVYIERVGQHITPSHLTLGAQDLWCENNGAYTGGISAQMLADVGAEYVIIGHSERRINNCEQGALLTQKLDAASAQGLVPIFCVGENVLQKQLGQTFETIEQQLQPLINLIKRDRSLKCVVAYEPVWSIGTGSTASKMDIENVNLFIKKRFREFNYSMAVLYGGSVNDTNIEQFLTIDVLEGVMLGNASLSATKMGLICQRVETHLEHSTRCV